MDNEVESTIKRIVLKDLFSKIDELMKYDDSCEAYKLISYYAELNGLKDLEKEVNKKLGWD